VIGQYLANVLANMDLNVVPILDDLNPIVMGDQSNLSLDVNLRGQELEEFS
jgi:hypothetical protein